MAAGRRSHLRERPALAAVAGNHPQGRLAGHSAGLGREHDLRAVRGPRGLRAELDHLPRRAARGRHDPHASTRARVERDPLAVGRPCRLHVLPAIARDRQFARPGREGRHIDLETSGGIGRVGDGPAVRGERRRQVVARSCGQALHGGACGSVGDRRRRGRALQEPVHHCASGDQDGERRRAPNERLSGSLVGRVAGRWPTSPARLRQTLAWTAVLGSCAEARPPINR